MNNIKCLNVMHHTHWDREWYETFEEFRYKLRDGLRYVQKLIENKTIDCFFVDGQTMVLDDYSQIVSSEEFENLKKLIKKGKIEIGPWYVLADEFLVNGESLIKNLEIGTNIAKELGSEYNIGYLPDTFGHISQMPQVLDGYGIKNAIIWRGAVSKSFENNWIGSDGTKVLTFVLPLFDGYFQTYMKRDNWEELLTKYIEDNKPYCDNGQILAMNGADHTYTSDNIKDRLDKFKENNKNLDVEQVLMSDFVKKFENFKPNNNIIGEQRNQNKIFTLPGVFSTRMYLKQKNQKCEDEMINTLEFLNVWSNGETNSKEFITYLWKLLVQNHAHDSICGCSIDEVHSEMEVRFQKILSAINQFKISTLEKLYGWDYISNNFVNDKLYLINNIPFKDKYIVEADIIVPFDADKGGICLKYNNSEIEFDLIERKCEEVLFRDIKIEPHYANVYIYKVKFLMDFDGIESKVLDIQLVENNNQKSINNSLKEIENEFYKIYVDENSLSIFDKISKKEYKNQHIFVSSLDAGDTYNYSPPKNDIINQSTIKDIEVINKNNIFEEMVILYDLNVPIGLTENRETGSETYINMPITTKITLNKNINKIFFETKLNNIAENHKLKIGFNLDECNIHYSDTAFDVVKRGVLRNQCLDVKPKEELECNQHPTLSTIFANDMQLIHLGMQEYEVCEYNNKDFCFITALRCVGDLSRRDLRTRGGGAGPGYETPDAQCKRQHTFNYALILGKENFNINNKNIIRTKPIVKQSNKLVQTYKLIEVTNKNIAYSSLLINEKNNLQLRLFNTNINKDDTTIILNSKFKKANLIKLDGTVLKQLDIDNNKINLTLDSKKIYTIEFIKE